MFIQIASSIVIVVGLIGGFGFMKYGELVHDDKQTGALERFVFGVSVCSFYIMTFPISVPLTLWHMRKIQKN